jgi:hypothetical protein
MKVLSSFIRGICYGLVCGVLAAVCLLALVYFTIGLNDSNGIVNLYTLLLCLIFGVVGAIIGGLIGIVVGFIPTTRAKEHNGDEPPIALP